MAVRIILPVVLILVAMVLFWRWYRHKMTALRPDADRRPLPGARLTAERLRTLSSPPWRVVYEIGPQLGAIDHVVIGPTGVIAVETVMTDRPEPDPAAGSDPHWVAAAAIARGEVDDVTGRVGVPCDLIARVHWGAPRPDRQPSDEVKLGSGTVTVAAVEGHRLTDWLVARPPGTLSSAQVDEVWRAILVAIGRPDPLT